MLGLAGLLWSGLGVVNALQYAWNTAWQVRAGSATRPWGSGGWPERRCCCRFRSPFAGSSAALVPGAVGSAGCHRHRCGLDAHTLPNRVGWRALLPAAVVGAAGFEVLKVVASFRPRAVASSSLYGPWGSSSRSWLALLWRLVVYSAVIEVVLLEGDTER